MWERRKLIDFDTDLSIRRQCAFLEINRSGLYYKALIDDDSEWANLGSYKFQVGKHAELTLLKSNPPVIRYTMVL